MPKGRYTPCSPYRRPPWCFLSFWLKYFIHYFFVFLTNYITNSAQNGRNPPTTHRFSSNVDIKIIVTSLVQGSLFSDTLMQHIVFVVIIIGAYIWMSIKLDIDCLVYQRYFQKLLFFWWFQHLFDVTGSYCLFFKLILYNSLTSTRSDQKFSLLRSLHC